jgi:CubicO group peptidase (beta-lactamase class C family)
MSSSFSWQTAPPETGGFDSAALNDLWAALAARKTTSLLIIRRDQIIFERYAPDWGPERQHYTASLAKALVGGMSLLLVLDDRLIAPDDPACQYIPQWQDHPQKSHITIRCLATHTAGVEDAELSQADRQRALAEGRALSEHHMELPGWKGAFWRKEPDPFTLSRDDAPVIFPPGSRYAYSNPGMAMLAYAVTASLKDAPHKDIRTLLRERIMRPIGVDDQGWSIGYGQTYDVEGLLLVANWGGGSFTPRAVARVARLMLNNGAWEGRQLISPARVRETLAYAGMPLPDRVAAGPVPASGLGWYTNFDGVWPAVPRDAFAGAGAGHQVLLVVPGLDLIVVRNGEQLDPDLSFWAGAEQHLFTPLMKALTPQPAYPPSSVIQSVEWGPVSGIIRLAAGGKTRDGSDNWPLTWADDDHLYTAYGDGYGFEPGLPRKLGLGFGVVMGHPETGLTALNIRSDAENEAHGRHGKKASGLLMVGGVLYMWARNANEAGQQSQLAWSADYAKTWRWAEWRFEEFGYMTFVNFGPNYAGAPDDYVYAVSHDHPGAYEVAGRFILTRVPKDRLTDRTAYRFFKALNANGAPLWTENIAERGPVFSQPGNCSRSGISYNAGLGRYLWWQQHRIANANAPGDQVDTRFQGGFALYDAPQLWGPWTTACFIHQWDAGPGETASFPTKWMSDDGRTLYLVFSGNDNFSVRRADLKIAE